MNQYHYVVVYDEVDGWRIDPLQEEIRFVDGTIYDTDTHSWESGYQGEGIFFNRECELTEQLTIALNKLGKVSAQ
jgi:hypothetical protein